MEDSSRRRLERLRNSQTTTNLSGICLALVNIFCSFQLIWFSFCDILTFQNSCFTNNRQHCSPNMPSKSVLNRFYDHIHHRFQNRRNPPSQSHRDPPPYATISFKLHGISATDTPQWLWSTAQCQSWITAVAITLWNCQEEEAERLASMFHGSGSYLWCLESETWKAWYGSARGTSIFNMLRACMKEPGAVPKSITFDHDWGPEDEGGSSSWCARSDIAYRNRKAMEKKFVRGGRPSWRVYLKIDNIRQS